MNPLTKYNERPPFAEFGYEPQTTFWGDFGVADVFVLNGQEPDAVEDTYKRASKGYKDDRVYGTELSMVLNHKIFEHYDKHKGLARIYDKLWKELDAYIMDNWKEEDLAYYIKTTD